MRSHNKARLIDITEKKLDPTQKYTVGADGRLTPSPAPQETKSSEEKEEKEVTENLVELPVVFGSFVENPTDNNQSNNSKKKNSKNKKVS